MMNKESAETLIKELDNCNVLVHIGSTPGGEDYINAKILISRADIIFDDDGVLVKEKDCGETEVRITYANLLDIKMFQLSNTIITYRYKTVVIELEF